MKYNLLGKKFGKLTVLERTDRRSTKRGVLWRCQCECGRELLVSTENLNNGHTQSCGHHKLEKAHEIIGNSMINGTKTIAFNNKPNKNNSLGVRGVTSYQQSGKTKYKAHLYTNGMHHQKKGFSNIDEAKAYRKDLEEKYLPKSEETEHAREKNN